jgi:hypothetical protein
MKIVADMWEPASLFVVPCVPGASPVGWGMGSDHRTLYRSAPNKKTTLENTAQIPLGNGLRNAIRVALMLGKQNTRITTKP